MVEERQAVTQGARLERDAAHSDEFSVAFRYECIQAYQYDGNV